MAENEAQDVQKLSANLRQLYSLKKFKEANPEKQQEWRGKAYDKWVKPFFDKHKDNLDSPLTRTQFMTGKHDDPATYANKEVFGFTKPYRGISKDVDEEATPNFIKEEADKINKDRWKSAFYAAGKHYASTIGNLEGILATAFETAGSLQGHKNSMGATVGKWLRTASDFNKESISSWQALQDDNTHADLVSKVAPYLGTMVAQGTEIAATGKILPSVTPSRLKAVKVMQDTIHEFSLGALSEYLHSGDSKEALESGAGFGAFRIGAEGTKFLGSKVLGLFKTIAKNGGVTAGRPIIIDAVKKAAAGQSSISPLFDIDDAGNLVPSNMMPKGLPAPPSGYPAVEEGLPSTVRIYKGSPSQKEVERVTADIKKAGFIPKGWSPLAGWHINSPKGGTFTLTPEEVVSARNIKAAMAKKLGRYEGLVSSSGKTTPLAPPMFTSSELITQYIQAVSKTKFGQSFDNLGWAQQQHIIKQLVGTSDSIFKIWGGISGDVYRDELGAVVNQIKKANPAAAKTQEMIDTWLKESTGHDSLDYAVERRRRAAEKIWKEHLDRVRKEDAFGKLAKEIQKEPARRVIPPFYNRPDGRTQTEYRGITITYDKVKNSFEALFRGRTVTGKDADLVANEIDKALGANQAEIRQSSLEDAMKLQRLGESISKDTPKTQAPKTLRELGTNPRVMGTNPRMKKNIEMGRGPSNLNEPRITLDGYGTIIGPPSASHINKFKTIGNSINLREALQENTNKLTKMIEERGQKPNSPELEQALADLQHKQYNTVNAINLFDEMSKGLELAYKGEAYQNLGIPAFQIIEDNNGKVLAGAMYNKDGIFSYQKDGGVVEFPSYYIETIASNPERFFGMLPDEAPGGGALLYRIMEQASEEEKGINLISSTNSMPFYGRMGFTRTRENGAGYHITPAQVKKFVYDNKNKFFLATFGIMGATMQSYKALGATASTGKE